MTGMNSEFLSDYAILSLGLGSVGTNVLIHSRAVLVNCKNIFLGSNVRIDPFVLISASEEGVHIGRNVHIAAYVSVVGAGRVDVGDFAGLSQGVRVLSSSDDFSGAHMTGPTLPDRYKSISSAAVFVGRHVVIGAGCVILPGSTIGEGTAVGALSLVNRDLDPWFIYAGVPAHVIKERKRDLLRMEADYIAVEDSKQSRRMNGPDIEVT